MRNNALQRFFFRLVPAKSLAGLRIGTGLVMLLEMTGITSLFRVATSQIDFPAHAFTSEAAYRLAEGFRLAYPALERLPVPSFAGYQALEVGLLVLAIAWTIGLLVRFTGPALFLGVAYLFALSQFEFTFSGLLFVLTLAILAWAPTHKAWSLDSLVFKSSSLVTIYWQRLLQILVSVVYISSAVMKLNDAWLSGDTLELMVRADAPEQLISWITAIMPSFQALAYIIVAVSFFLAVGLRHNKLKRFALVIGLLFHLGIDITFDLGVLNYQLLVLYLAFLGVGSSREQGEVQQSQSQQEAKTTSRHSEGTKGVGESRE